MNMNMITRISAAFICIAGSSCTRETKPAPTSGSPIALRLGGTAQERSARNRQVSTANERCMSQQGFRYVTPHFDGPKVSTNVGSSGYGIVVDPTESARQIVNNPDPNFAYLQHLTIADQNRCEQVFGICNARSVAVVPVQVPNGIEFDRLVALRNSADRKFDADPRVLALRAPGHGASELKAGHSVGRETPLPP